MSLFQVGDKQELQKQSLPVYEQYYARYSCHIKMCIIEDELCKTIERIFIKMHSIDVLQNNYKQIQESLKYKLVLLTRIFYAHTYLKTII